MAYVVLVLYIYCTIVYCIVSSGNGCFGMGDNSMGQCGVGTSGKNLDIIIPKQCEVDYPVKQAACGLDFTLFLTEKGMLILNCF